MKFDQDINKNAEFEEKSYNFNEVAEEAAAKKGLIVVLPEPNQLQIDVDSEEAYLEFCKRYQNMDMQYSNYGTPKIKETFSNSGPPHRHITLTFENHIFTEWERIALQAVLGSDPIREYLNAKRLIFGEFNPTRLFEKRENI